MNFTFETDNFSQALVRVGGWEGGREVLHSQISTSNSQGNLFFLENPKAIYLFLVPFLAPQPCGRAVIIINAQKLIIYYAVYDAIGRQNLNTQQDITASSSAV